MASDTAEVISDLMSKLTINKKILKILTEENGDLSDPDSATALLKDLFKLSESISKWYTSFKIIPKRIKDIHNGIKEDLTHFSATHAHMTSYDKDYQPLLSMRT